MRVIAGSAKGTPLQAVPGTGTRPISDRVKESLFNILGGEVEGARVLDLFAGTGSVGIEALSRGAEHATFVEKHPKAAAIIRANLQRTRLQGQGTIVQNDVYKYLSGPPSPFDLIYIAPPQYQGLWLKALLAIDGNPAWLEPTGLVVVQIFPKELEAARLSFLQMADQRQYGSTLLCFYETLETEG
ncbi:MAG TPA: 16S rRNA (guanine(966)-N(2))-methyltransferase RsmD [Anaerolineae bacterium]|nr:16S rRNA (guanine(966)-N(2))-methyltransferase RsmD [Anaerolineae bacterium]